MSHLLILLHFFFLFITLSAQSNNQIHPNCRKQNCGDITINYPFWKKESESTYQFCGYQGFGINCSNFGELVSPEISLGSDSYYVQSINHGDNSVILTDRDIFHVVSGSKDCPRVRHGINLENVPLRFTEHNVNLSFHFNCTGCPVFATEIPCLDNKRKKSCARVMNASTKETHWHEYLCSEEVVTTVMRQQMNFYPNLSTDFGSPLGRGFELEWWSKDDKCQKCEESAGMCGHCNTTGFICFCSDGTTSKGDCIGPPFTVKLKIEVAIVAGSILLPYFSIYIIYSILKSLLRHKTDDEKNVEDFVLQCGSLSIVRYTYNDIKKMTNSFRVKLGHGGFGQVFKGKLSDGRFVAVKVLNSSKANGQEFINEVASIGRTSHVNIVTLLGFCFDHTKRALVYEYMPNGSLEKFINGHVHFARNEFIGFKKLYEIALGIAYGLDYLHRGCNTRILHLDIKPHNILLDEDFCPKIADFGLAKLYSRKESIVSMLEARGTIGYIAPEVYNKNFGGVSHKSDVYSYGMLLLEMVVGGRKNVDTGVPTTRSSEIYFPDWIYNRLEKKDFLFDSILTTEENDYARKMTIVGLWCIQTAPNQRPSIDKVIEMLEGSMEVLKYPPKPFFSSSPQRSYATISSTSESMLEIT